MTERRALDSPRGAGALVASSGRWTRTQGARRVAGVLAVVAFAGLLCGCISGSPPSGAGPAPPSAVTGDDPGAGRAGQAMQGVTPTEFQPVTDADVAEARSWLTARGVTSAELADACGYYTDNGWAYAEALNAASNAGPPRVAEVVAEVSAVAEAIALPREWVTSVTEGIDKPFPEWTEAERNTYIWAVTVRKSKLIEPLCTP